MPRTRRTRKNAQPSTSASSANDEYTYDTLPEERKKRLQSMIEDMDKETEERIATANTTLHSICQSIRNDYRVALYQLTKQQRDMSLEELVQRNIKDKEDGLVSSRESMILKTQLEEVAENVTSTVKSKVKATGRTSKKSKRNETMENVGKPGPMTSTAFSNRKCGKIPDAVQNLSAIMPVTSETPKAVNGSINRPLRLAKPNEFGTELGMLGLSLNNSPILIALGNITPTRENAISSIIETTAVSKIHGEATCSITETTARTKIDEESTVGTSIDADMEAYKKVQSVRDQIEKMKMMKD